MNRRFWMLLILAVGITLGSLREFLFVNLNYQIDHTLRQTEFSYAHSSFQRWVAGWGPVGLLRLKWSLGLFFTGAMLALTLLFARQVYGSHRHARSIALAFAITGAVALALNLLSWWWPPLEAVAVKLLHLLQYPVLLFFVWAASRLKVESEG